MSTSSEQIFIGIDVSKTTLDLAVRGQTKVQQFANTEPGIAALMASLAAQKESIAVIVMEATGGLWLSANAGEAWHCVSRDLPPLAALQFVN